MPTVKEIYDSMVKTPTEEERALIERAYQFSETAHEGQTRFSGEPYFNHTFEVAKNLARFKMDPITISAGLLHDVLEDAHVSPEELEKKFGTEILFLVEGVSKLGKLKYRGIERHTESLRKLFMAMSKDVRVIIIKCADRLHNVKTLEHVRPDKQKRIALETLEIYAPLANRFGMGRLRSELEEYSFPYAYPEDYKKVRALVQRKQSEEEEQLEKFYRSVKKKLAKEGYATARSDRRRKGTYSLWNKLKLNEMDISKIYDILAIRIVVPDVSDCYKVLGIIHSMWRPLPGRIKDYIAFPKPNGYQSIHTTVFTGDGGIMEIQVRTEDMHQEAEYGIASHLAYKENFYKNKKKLADLNKKYGWIQELIDWQKNVSESGEFLQHLKMDFFENRVFVFTPEGDVIDLPMGSCAVDFAYAIHSDIGDHMSGARVNGKFVSLDTELRNGDIVFIETKKSVSPTSKWLEYAKTTLAKKHIRNSLHEKKYGKK